MSKQVFLGGTCGRTTWRRDVAIPALEAAGVTYHDPQLAPHAWSAEAEAESTRAKDGAAVLLFVITGTGRGVASLVEVAYLLAAGRPLALAVEDIPAGAEIDGQPVSEAERTDLNRGRWFVRAMAVRHGVPVFGGPTEATAHAIRLVKSGRSAAV